MVRGVLFVGYMLATEIFSKSDFLIQHAIDADKFSLGDTSFSLSSMTIWVMIIFGLTENIRNLMVDQNYTQKYFSVATEKEAKKSVWFALLIYLPLTVVFLYIGTALFSVYSSSAPVLDPYIVKGDQVFPFFIATELPVGMKRLIIAGSMSTVDSALN